jgi:molybdate transport system substrate-binding protein
MGDLAPPEILTLPCVDSSWKSEIGNTARRLAMTRKFLPLTRVHVLASCAATLVLLAAPTAGRAAELRVLSAAAMQSVFKEVASEFARTSGHKLIIEYGTIGGVAQRVQNGDAPDFVIGSSLSMPALIKEGKIQPASQLTICKTAIGMVVPAGAAKPRLASVEDFKRALVAAQTIVYADPARGGAAGVHIGRVTEQLGLAEALKPKTRLAAGGDVTEVTIGLGPSALGMTQVSEIVQKPEAQLVGLLPGELQNYTVFVGGIPSGAKQSEALAAFIQFLSSPTAIAAITAKGMQVE